MTDNMISEYLEFLACQDRRAVSVENLCCLQQAHLEKIPYNNLEIFCLNKVPSLNVETVFDKMIRRKQGGYCFELNGLFAELLRNLGYSVREYFARWHFGGSDPVPKRRHRVIEVSFGDLKMIADVGIGSAGSVIPFELVFDKIQMRPVRNYRFDRDNGLGIVLSAETQNGWVPYFSFFPEPHYPQDFEYVNYYCANHPESIFRKKFFMHRQTENIQYYVEDLQLAGEPLNFCIRKSKDDIEKIPILSKAQFSGILKECFGIAYPPDELSGGVLRGSK